MIICKNNVTIAHFSGFCFLKIIRKASLRKIIFLHLDKTLHIISFFAIYVLQNELKSKQIESHNIPVNCKTSP